MLDVQVGITCKLVILAIFQMSYALRALISDLYFSRKIPGVGGSQSELSFIATSFSGQV